jgi:hypothetical protein
MSAELDTEPEGRQGPARRALLTGGAVGLAAVAGATFGRVQPASAGTEAVSWIMPSNETSGNTDTSTIQSTLNSSGFVWLGPGEFYINKVITIPHKAAVLGVGAETRVMCVGKAGFYMHDTNPGDGNNRTANSSGHIRDLIIDGTKAGSDAVGLDIGDGWGYRLDHVFVENFTGSAAIGIYMNNQNYFTEKMLATSIHVRNCTTQVLLAQGPGGPSFEYCDLAFYFAIQPGQDGFVVSNGGYLAGGSLKIRGNAYSQQAKAAQGYVIRVGTSTSGNGDGSCIGSCCLDVAVEQNLYDSGYGYIPGTIYFANSNNTMLNDYGMLVFRDTPWTPSNLATDQQFTFRGICGGDSNLTTYVQVPVTWV